VQYSRILAALISTRTAEYNGLLPAVFKRFELDDCGQVELQGFIDAFGRHRKTDDPREDARLAGHALAPEQGKMSFSQFATYIMVHEAIAREQSSTPFEQKTILRAPADRLLTEDDLVAPPQASYSAGSACSSPEKKKLTAEDLKQGYPQFAKDMGLRDLGRKEFDSPSPGRNEFDSPSAIEPDQSTEIDIDSLAAGSSLPGSPSKGLLGSPSKGSPSKGLLQREQEKQSSWEVLTAQGWQPWAPGVHFCGAVGEEVFFTLGSTAYKASFESQRCGTQTNLSTNVQCKLRRSGTTVGDTSPMSVGTVGLHVLSATAGGPRAKARAKLTEDVPALEITI